jgi:hypothetical protein
MTYYIAATGVDEAADLLPDLHCIEVRTGCVDPAMLRAR